MFGSNDKSKGNRNQGNVETLIGPRVVIRGDLHFSGGLYVEGTIHGAVIADESDADAVITLSERGLIEGEVRAPHVVINGQLRGDVYASQKVHMAAAARVSGNVYYNVVEMQAGAMLTGRLIHSDAPLKQLTGPKDNAD
ncbi:MAG: polymer-forming cytoskeletal family protein [Dechloromonas sp.]|jgi:cytoskeletal protein CcmA (bactofilin family)|nr:polymer-forming cytoskeletal protein [Xanthomonadales bacterium]TXI72631.1 MAG: polymer-forming cytoskeletal family protein [Dechloromonas sp.]HRD72780.1 polymer-forming cytoskeletal protein [Aquimonas sp.]HRF54625.1 polymer-forming cytoskeletal protein [Aquimonas sp.]